MNCLKRIVLSLCFLFCLHVLMAEKLVRIACVGNSITYGAGITNREQNSYPSQLQYYLGSGYEVRNFGSNGATVQVEGDYPYVGTTVYKESLEFLPDIVLLKLGTNDTKPQNWKGREQFVNQVILVTPVRCFLTSKGTINPKLIENDVRNAVEELAYTNGLGIINLFNVFGDKWEESLMPDRLHPSSIGAGRMSRKIGGYILSGRSTSEKKSFVPKSASSFNFHGYRGYEFKVDGVSCKMVKPLHEAKGRPWVWRARFWGHEPQLDIDLLERGFHIVYCDVANLYGSDKAVDRWNKFYDYLAGHGFCKRAVLEGMSRGGLIVYNWTAKNPGKVACIYADAPVMDIKSWPMGKGASRGSGYDVKQMCSVYGFQDEQDALNWKGNPLDHCSIIAKSKIPVLHVVGDADDVVPVSENTGVFESEMKRLKAGITVIHKPGVGHHPHSLNNPSVIVDFILKSTGYYSNPCTHALPGNEYRSGAGWTEGSEWHSVSSDIESSLENRKLELLLLGNSITQGWGGSRKRVVHKPGKAALDRVIGAGSWESAGISGDRTENLLWRIRHGNYNRCHPENVVIAIGINNLISGGNTSDDTAEGIVAVTEESCRQFPKSKIILLGLFPSGKEKNSDIRKKCDRVHELLGNHRFSKRVLYVNPTGWFLNQNGDIKDGLYGGDYIHLTGKGYECVAERLGKLIEKKNN